MNGTLIRTQNRISDYGLSIRAAASEAGVSFSSLARALRGDGGITPPTDRKLRRWLGDDVPEIAALPPTIPMPQSREHAEMMLLVAERYLKDNPGN